ncbi:Pre-mRNA splicing factor prp1 [Scheffersomyces xylosifermentans]|uniref:Pre-mRNA splicing factor prp1 n=1 Tax=Scheffersomyces xylosifermentans TaxID=1304137 RepID=UPI00315C5C9B
MSFKDFLDQEPPPGYVAGIGRGATGFTTSADTGGIQPGFSFQNDENDDDDDENGNNSHLDAEDGSILAITSRNDKEDEEADRIYEEIEKKLRSRNKSATSKTSNANNKIVGKIDKEDQIKDKFSDLKRSLAAVSSSEWESLPEVGDLTRRNKRTRLLEQQQQRTYAVPDSVIAGSTSLGGGIQSRTDFKSISESKDKLLSSQLDRLLPQSNELNLIDAEETNRILDEKSDSQIADIRKGRSILASLRRTEPHKSSSWIASARLEEQAQNHSAAKRLIEEGCKNAPKNEDVWLESIRIHKQTSEGTKMCKVIVNEALKFNSRSEKLWLQAEELENTSDTVSRRRTLMRALEALPNNANLWRRLINLETDEEDVHKLLQRAVELCPKEWEFWLTLINLSDYKEAKNLLNKARKALDGNYFVWLTASKLEERENSSIEFKKISKLMEKAFHEVRKSHHNVPREVWLKEAETAESEGFSKTCQAIVYNLLDSESDDEQQNLNQWFNDAEAAAAKKFKETANNIYKYVIHKFPHNISSWVKLLGFLRKTSSDQSVINGFYKQAIELNPTEEIFPLMFAKDKWQIEGDIEGARSILLSAYKLLPENESIWLARVKLEVKTFNYDSAKEISETAVKLIPNSSARLWYKHIHLLRLINVKTPSDKYELRILSVLGRALELFPHTPQLHLQKAQIFLCDLKKPDFARESASIGVKQCPESIPLWILLSRIDEEHIKIVIRARSVLDTAMLKNPKSDALWAAKIQLERRNKDLVAARQLTNKALKIFPSSSCVWIEYLSLIPKMSQRKTAFVDAMKNTNNSPEILLQIGIFFWLDGKHSKAKAWFERALNNDNCNGDSWGWLYLFLDGYGTTEEKNSLLQKFNEKYEGINKGETWNATNKDLSNFEKTPVELLHHLSKSLLNKYKN